MGEVRIAMVRADFGCGVLTGGNGGFGEVSEGIDYLANSVGADVIMIGKSFNTEDDADQVDAHVKNLTSDFEAHPDVLFVVAGANDRADCDDANIFCWPANNEASNTLRVLATGVDWEGGDPETMTGEWEEADTRPDDGLLKGTDHGSQTFNLAAPGFLYFDWVDNGSGGYKPEFTFGLNLLKFGSASNGYRGWDPTESTISGGQSLSMALVAGAAGLTKSACPTLSGADLADALLESAETSPPASTRTEDDRYLDVAGAVSCTP